MVYFSSRREDIKGYQGDLDLYMAYIESIFRAIVVKIYVADDSHLNTTTYITVDNPVSKRKVKEKLTEKDSEMSMVLSNKDYGKIHDSIPFVDLKIIAENFKFGNKQKIMRIKNPLLEQNKGGWVFNNELDETFEMSVSPELDAYLDKMKRTILDASVQPYDPKKEERPDTLPITIEEFQSSNTKPLLPYIFFDKNSDIIPEKYVKIAQANAEEFSADSLYNLGTIETYYHLLNIVGWRMNMFRNTTIELTGCNSGNEEPEVLSVNRINIVKNYLMKVWSIDSARISTVVRNLPYSPSSGQTEEGREENRRVELSSSDERLLLPVTTREILKVATPETIKFNSFVSVKHGEATWQLLAMQDGKTIKSFSGEGSLKADLTWNINDEKKTMPTTESPVYVELLVKEKSKDKVIVSKAEMPVRQITTKLKSTIYVEDKRIDKYSLILFDFGKSKLNEGNLKIIKMIKDSINPDSKLIITGYSDRIGNDDFNMKLSERRAEETSKALGVKNSDIFAIGEEKHLYNNDLPEGRFYCRTVEIVIETKLKK